MRKRNISVPIAIVFSFFGFASYAESTPEVRESAKRLANAILNKAQESARQDITPDSAKPSVGDAINYKGTNLPETQYQHGNMYDAAKQKADDKNNTEAQIAGTAFLRQKEYPITHKDNLLDKAKFAQKNPEHYVDWLTGKYTDCKQDGGEGVTSNEIKVCNEYKSLNENSCSIGRLIEVAAKHKYECIKERKHYEKTCEQKLQLQCKEWEEGIIIKTKPLVGHKFENFDADSLYQILFEKGKMGPSPYHNHRAPCKYIKPKVSQYGHFLDGIAGLSEVRAFFLINEQNIEVKAKFGGSLPPFGNEDLRKYFKKEGNLYEVEFGNRDCVRSEFTFDYIDKLSCKDWNESWEESCG